MKYADWKAERERVDRDIKAVYAVSEPQFAKLNAEQVRLDEATHREYQLSDRVSLVVRADWFYLKVKDDSRYQEHTVDLTGLTVRDLEIAIETMKFRNRWLSGEVAELPPSGDLTGKVGKLP